MYFDIYIEFMIYKDERNELLVLDVEYRKCWMGYIKMNVSNLNVYFGIIMIG